MKVAYLVNQYPKVSHTFIRREIAALEALGVEVLRVSIRPGDEASLPEPADRAELGRTRVLLAAGASGLLAATLRTALSRPLCFLRAALLALRLGLRSDRGLLRHAAWLAEACLLAGWLQRAGIDRLHAHFGTNPADVALLCRVLGGPAFSLTVHGPEEFERAAGLGLDTKVARASAVFAISEFGRSQLYRHCSPATWDRIHVVRCGLDASLLEREPTPVPDVRRLVFVGRLGGQKGLPVLLDAVARLVAARVPLELVLAGDGELRGPLESRIAALGLQARVAIIGWVSGREVRELLEGARGLVLPSFAEGLPVVLMEALALGRPVVATWVAGIPELVEHGRCGWLVPPGSVERLADALRALLETPAEQLTRLGAEGRRRVASQHDAATGARAMLALWSGGDGRVAAVRGAPDEPPAAPVHGSFPMRLR